MAEKLEGAERERRRGLTDHEAMQDAQSMCVPCKLCGSAAHISDAGPGSGYYIRCSNSRTFRDYDGCLISDRRVSGWAYNVAEWWNRLHATPDRSDDALAEDRDKIAWLVAAGMWGDEAASLYFDPRYDGSPDIRRGQAKHTADRIVAYIRAALKEDGL